MSRLTLGRLNSLTAVTLDDMTSSYSMSKIPTLLLCQLAFDWFCSETSLPQLKQDLLELRQVFLPRGTENGDVIYVYASAYLEQGART